MSTLRILSLDGGGMRGLISARFLELFVQQWGINGNELWKHFDIIAGTSIGGILALGLANGISPTEGKKFFTDDGPWIFTTNTTTPSQKPDAKDKAVVMISDNKTFYPSNDDNIGTKRLKSKLDSIFTSNTMQSLKTNVLITSFEQNDVEPEFEKYTNTPIYFSNSSVVPYLSGQNNLITDVAMATSAAPLYFPAWKIDKNSYTVDPTKNSYADGGVVCNNPAMWAYAVGKALKPNANRTCILSVGTGLGDVGFPPNPSTRKKIENRIKAEMELFRKNKKEYATKYNINEENIEKLDELQWFNNIYYLMYLIDVMTTGPQEIVDKELEIMANYTLDPLYYYRMQYYLKDDYDTLLDTSDPITLKYYEDSATEYFNKDIAKISTFITRLDIE